MKLNFEQISYSNVRKECFDDKERKVWYLKNLIEADEDIYLESEYFLFGYIHYLKGTNFRGN